VDIDIRGDALNGELGKLRRQRQPLAFPNPLGRCHCGQPSLPIGVNGHIDDAGGSLNDGITSGRSEGDNREALDRESAGHAGRQMLRGGNGEGNYRATA
jgi:hypothetical protein